jgi:hypothetical protein
VFLILSEKIPPDFLDGLANTPTAQHKVITLNVDNNYWFVEEIGLKSQSNYVNESKKKILSGGGKTDKHTNLSVELGKNNEFSNKPREKVHGERRVEGGQRTSNCDG